MEIIICDDFLPFAESIKKIINDILNRKQYYKIIFNKEIKLFAKSSDLLEYIHETPKIRLYFLDIDLEEDGSKSEGITLAKQILEINDKSYISYISSYNLIDAAVNEKTQPIGYILKNESDNTTFRIANILDYIYKKTHGIDIKGSRYIVNRIIYVEVLKNKNSIAIHSENSLSVINITLKDVYEILQHHNFVQCTRDSIINLEHIKKIDGNIIHLSNGHIMEYSRTYAYDFRKKYKAFLNM